MTTKKDLQDAADSLLKQGKIKQVGWKDGQPIYDVTEAGRPTIGQQAVESLHGEGTFVKALDAAGAPKLNENGNQVYKDFDYATEAELAFFKKEKTEAGRAKQYTLEELKAIGPPFQEVRICVFLKECMAEVNFLVSGETLRTTVQIPFEIGSQSVSEVGEAILESAQAEGLITDGTVYEVYDGDAPELPPAPIPESAELRALRAKAAELWPSLQSRKTEDRER